MDSCPLYVIFYQNGNEERIPTPAQLLNCTAIFSSVNAPLYICLRHLYLSVEAQCPTKLETEDNKSDTPVLFVGSMVSKYSW